MIRLRTPLAISIVLVATATFGVLLGPASADIEPAAPEPAPADPAPIDPCGRFCGNGGVRGPSVVSEIEVFGPGGGSTVVIPSGPSPFADCAFTLVPAGEDLNLTGRTVSRLSDGKDHWEVGCPDRALSGGFAGFVYPDGEPPPATIIQDLLSDAYQRTPVVAFNPVTSPDGDDDIFVLVQAPTFLWVDQAAWSAPVSAVASIPGFSVTTTATADVAYWSGGDEPVTCVGDDMQPYVFGIGGDEAQPSNCVMVYKRSSALQENTVDLQVTWDVTGSCSIPTACSNQPLPDIITNSTRVITVGEIQAVSRASN